MSGPRQIAHVSPWRQRPLGMVARATVVVLTLCAIAGIIWLGRVVFFAAFFAGLVAAFLSIPVGLLERLRVPRVIAALISALGVIAILAGLIALAWPTLAEQLGIIRARLPEALLQLVEWGQRLFLRVAGELGDPDPETIQELRDGLMEQFGALVVGALPVLNTFFGAIAGAAVAFFAGFYFTLGAERYAREALRIVPPEGRERVRGAVGEAAGTLRRWMLGTSINMVAVGVSTGIVLWILGIPAPFALGLIAGLFEFVPILGPWLAALPAVAIALIVAPELALWVIVAFVAIQQLESNLLTPIVMRGVVHLPPALTLLFQSLMAILFGFLGLLLAVPILAVLMVMVRRLYMEPMEERARASMTKG